MTINDFDKNNDGGDKFLEIGQGEKHRHRRNVTNHSFDYPTFIKRQLPLVRFPFPKERRLENLTSLSLPVNIRLAATVALD